MDEPASITQGTRSNRDGIGARITLYAAGRNWVQEVRSGSSYISSNDLRLHFGLGSVTEVEKIDVAWPSGLNESFTVHRARRRQRSEDFGKLRLTPQYSLLIKLQDIHRDQIAGGDDHEAVARDNQGHAVIENDSLLVPLLDV